MAIAQIPHYEELYNFLLSSPTPEQILAFRPSTQAQERMTYLLAANRSGMMTPDEQSELDEFMKVEHFMRMLKARAHQKIS